MLTECGDEPETEAHAVRVDGQFSQTWVDIMQGDQGDAPDDASDDSAVAEAVPTNPVGFDFQVDWLGDRVVNPIRVRDNYARLVANKGHGADAHAPQGELAGHQRALPAILKKNVRDQRNFIESRRLWDAYDAEVMRQGGSERSTEPSRAAVRDLRKEPPKPLRALRSVTPGRANHSRCGRPSTS